MEKVLTADERIRRAEQVYYKRKNQSGDKQPARVNVGCEKKDIGLFRKMILQIAICTVIYIIIYLIQTTNYVFSPTVLEKTKQILNYDIDIVKIYNESFTYLNGLLHKTNSEQQKITQNNEEVKENEAQNTLTEESIGGEEAVVEENLSQMEKDVKDILVSKSLIKPLLGVITSRYGPRQSDNPKVSKYHTGIDIAVNEGTTFIAAMEGIVTKVSDQGDYRGTCNYSK